MYWLYQVVESAESTGTQICRILLNQSARPPRGSALGNSVTRRKAGDMTVGPAVFATLGVLFVLAGTSRTDNPGSATSVGNSNNSSPDANTSSIVSPNTTTSAPKTTTVGNSSTSSSATKAPATSAQSTKSSGTTVHSVNTTTPGTTVQPGNKTTAGSGVHQV